MSEINITINVEGDEEEFKIKSPNRNRVKQPKMRIMRKKTKLGSSSVLQLPPMVDDSSVRPHGLLDMLGV